MMNKTIGHNIQRHLTGKEVLIQGPVTQKWVKVKHVWTTFPYEALCVSPNGYKRVIKVHTILDVREAQNANGRL